MKLEIVKATPPPLWKWMQLNLPKRLVAREQTEGYSEVYGISVREAGWFKPLIAEVAGNTVTLKHPEWTADFSDVLRRYEAAHPGIETTLKVCES